MSDQAWANATKRISHMIAAGVDPMEGLLVEGYGSTHTVEQHARLFAEANATDLAMIYPVLLAAFSGSTQGAFQAPLYSEDWSPNHVALVFQFIGIAESGTRKSTVLKEGKAPLEAAMQAGVISRRGWSVAQREAAKAAMDHLGVATDVHAPDWEKVYNGGVCASTFADSGTQEGVRNKLITNGGHRVILTGESDILREVSAYSRGGAGSLGLFIRTWDQETLQVDRASETSHLYMPEASLPFLIFVQPNSFTLHTSISQHGYDEFTDKGVFGRAWLWRMPAPSIPQEFAFQPKPKDGATSALAQARARTAWSLMQLVERSNAYRATKGIRYAWETSGASVWMPEPQKVERELLDLDGEAGIAAFAKVQNMLLDLRRALAAADAVDTGVSYQYHPLVSRFTDHVMRLATLLTLADDPGATAVDTSHIEDVATRLMPWLWSGWAEVMDVRRSANAEAAVNEEMLKNQSFADVSMGGVVINALAKLSANGPAAEAGFTASDITRRARSSLPKMERSGAVARMRKELDQMANEGLLVQKLTGAGEADALGNKAHRYKLTSSGHAYATKK